MCRWSSHLTSKNQNGDRFVNVYSFLGSLFENTKQNDIISGVNWYQFVVCCVFVCNPCQCRRYHYLPAIWKEFQFKQACACISTNIAADIILCHFYMFILLFTWLNGMLLSLGKWNALFKVASTEVLLQAAALYRLRSCHRILRITNEFFHIKREIT